MRGYSSAFCGWRCQPSVHGGALWWTPFALVSSHWGVELEIALREVMPEPDCGTDVINPWTA
jgi:hypothetical protein